MGIFGVLVFFMSAYGVVLLHLHCISYARALEMFFKMNQNSSSSGYSNISES